MKSISDSLTFIIPALNEEVRISRTLASIYREVKNPEIIVIDNGSIDKTVQLAQEGGAITKIFPNLNISELRNCGVAISSNETLIFLDADVELGEDWGHQIKKITSNLNSNPLQITGSTCLPFLENNLVNKYWYQLLKNKKQVNYINSGHLITTKQLFDLIHGFDSKLKTGEDYDFCMRATKEGASISPAAELKAYHSGYPTTIAGFANREIWHGTSDYNSVKSFVNSKVAIVSSLFSTLLVLSIIFSVQSKSVTPILLYVAGATLCSVGLSLVKFGRLPLRFQAYNSLLFFIYLYARSTSLFVRPKRSRKN